MQGKVAWFNIQKGYGFLTPDAGGSDVFVHIREMEVCKIGGLKEGDVIDFEIADGRNGRTCAKKLRFIRPGPVEISPGRGSLAKYS